MPSPFCPEDGKHHSFYQGMVQICPQCTQFIGGIKQSTQPQSLMPRLSAPSSASQSASTTIIDLDATEPAIATTLPRFPSYSQQASEVEAHRQSAIRKVTNDSKRTKANAGSSTHSSLAKASRVIPISDTVKILLVKGIGGSPHSFQPFGKQFQISYRITVNLST